MKNNSKKKNYQNTFSQILNSVDFIRAVDNDQEMNKPYIDEYTTHQQRLRDKKITELLNQYVAAYSYKNKSNKLYKGLLFGLCAFILLLFSIVFVRLMFKIDISNANPSIEGVVQLISVCITFLTLIVGITKIITKYVFPENEEEYITRIVEIIQNNDLKNKKENIRVKTKNQNSILDDNHGFEELD